MTPDTRRTSRVLEPGGTVVVLHKEAYQVVGGVAVWLNLRRIYVPGGESHVGGWKGTSMDVDVSSGVG